jgi:hypothetical protein
MAVCAVCEHPIVSAQRFVIEGTEVMHSACGRAGRTTILQRQRQEVANLNVRIASEQRQRVEGRSRIADLERRIALLDRQRGIDDQRYLDLQAEHRLLLVEVARVRREVVLRPAPQRATPETLPSVTVAITHTPVSPVSTPDATPASGDDTEIRMSLLELA